MPNRKKMKFQLSRFLRKGIVSGFAFCAISYGIFGIPVEVCAGDAASATLTFTRMDSLFLTAATGEPRFQSARDSSEKILLASGAATLDYLVAAATRDRTPRQRQYVEHLFTVMADSGRNPLPRTVLARAVVSAPNDTVRAQWLYIGSRMADTAFRAVALPWLGASSESVRRMAVRALGASPRPDNLPLLWIGLDTLQGLELHQRLWALDAHSPLRDGLRLVPLLANAQQFNRHKVREMLLRATDSNWVLLAAAMPKRLDDRSRREWRMLALDSKAGTGGRKFLEAEKPEMTWEDRVFFGVDR